MKLEYLAGFSFCVNYEVSRHAYPSCAKTLEGVPKIFSKFGTSWRCV